MKRVATAFVLGLLSGIVLVAASGSSSGEEIPPEEMAERFFDGLQDAQQSTMGTQGGESND